MTDPWGKEELDAVLALLPTFESPGFKMAEWQVFEPDENGITQMPYPTYVPIVDQLFALVAGVHPYDALPEDADDQGIKPETVFDLESFSSMSINQVRRYFSHCRRGERFCDGYIEGQFLNGKLLAALHRLHEIQQALA